MLHVLYGNDTIGRLKALDKIVAERQLEGEHIVSFSDTDAEIHTIESIISGSNLFGENSTLILRHLLTDVEFSEFVSSRIDRMVASPSTIVIVETEIPKDILKEFELHKAHAKVFTKKSEKKTPPAFAFADFFSSGDKKKSWLSYRKMRDEGIEADEILPILFWSIKTALIVSSQIKAGLDMESAGLSPYVYKKALQTTKKFSYKELSDFLGKLNIILHDARGGKKDLDQGLELFILQALA